VRGGFGICEIPRDLVFARARETLSCNQAGRTLPVAENSGRAELVGEDGEACAGGRRLAQREGLEAVVLREQPLAGAYGDREDHELVSVDQIVREQNVDELGRPIDQDLFARLLFERGDGLGNISVEERSVPRQRLLECSRDDELRQCVHADGELAFDLLHRGPSGSEPSNVSRPSSSASLAKSWSVW
jgi:hypothetical protein